MTPKIIFSKTGVLKALSWEPALEYFNLQIKDQIKIPLKKN